MVHKTSQNDFFSKVLLENSPSYIEVCARLHCDKKYSQPTITVKIRLR